MIVSILLADDHHLVRQGLRIILEAQGDFEVLGEAADGIEAVEMVERLKPDILITDLMMPRLNGLEATRQIHQRFSKTRVIVLSMHANEAYVLQALRNGASGYVLKDSTSSDLVQAVRKVARGERYLSSPLSERAISMYVEKAEATPMDAYETLTTREREILQLAAEGLSNAEIGERLSISARTAEVHRANMMRKLDLNNQTSLIRYALRRGILPMED